MKRKMASKPNTTQEISHQLSATTVVILLFLLPSISAIDLSSKNFIRTSCNTTLYPDLCYRSLSPYSNAIQQSPAQLARVAVKASLSIARQTATYIKQLIMNQTITNLMPEQPPRTLGALHDCYSTLNDAVYYMKMSVQQMYKLNSTTSERVIDTYNRSNRSSKTTSERGGESFGYLMSNVQTWMSAALTNEDTCTDGFEFVSSGPLKNCVVDRILNVEKFTSNALALVNGFVAYHEANNNGTTGIP